MKTRAEIKMDAKKAMAAQQGTSIGLMLVPSLLALAAYAAVSLVTAPVLGGNAFLGMTGSPIVQTQLTVAPAELGWMIAMLLVVWLVSLVISVLIEVAIAGGYTRIFRADRTSVMSVFGTLFRRWPRKLGAMLLMSLFVMLWSMVGYIPYLVGVALISGMANTQNSALVLLPALFMIAGMVLMIRKAISYSLVPYIVSEYPNVTAREAVRLSVRMTRGHLGKLFVLELSFIGWLILSTLTFMILAVVYVGPYMQLTMAGYYVELRNLALTDGIISPDEVGDSEYAAGT